MFRIFGRVQGFVCFEHKKKNFYFYLVYLGRSTYLKLPLFNYVRTQLFFIAQHFSRTVIPALLVKRVIVIELAVRSRHQCFGMFWMLKISMFLGQCDNTQFSTNSSSLLPFLSDLILDKMPPLTYRHFALDSQ